MCQYLPSIYLLCFSYQITECCNKKILYLTQKYSDPMISPLTYNAFSNTFLCMAWREDLG